MASAKRKRSISGYYHVFQRGVNKFDIFEDDEDRSTYLKILREEAEDHGVTICSWCLMSNHTHLVVRADLEDLSNMMRDLGSRYARRFNARHGRTGPLFEGRFISVCIDGHSQFIAAIRYVHRNPIEHEEATLLGEYKWTSYKEYVSNSPDICEIEFALELFGGIEKFIRTHREQWPYERHVDIGTYGALLDDQARTLADKALETADFNVGIAKIGSLVQELRDEAIAIVRQSVGCSLSQIQRLSGVPYSAIRRAVRIAAGNVEA